MPGGHDNQWAARPTRQGGDNASPGNDPGASMRDAPKEEVKLQPTGGVADKARLRASPGQRPDASI